MSTLQEVKAVPTPLQKEVGTARSNESDGCELKAKSRGGRLPIRQRKRRRGAGLRFQDG